MKDPQLNGFKELPVEDANTGVELSVSFRSSTESLTPRTEGLIPHPLDPAEWDLTELTTGELRVSIRNAPESLTSCCYGI